MKNSSNIDKEVDSDLTVVDQVPEGWKPYKLGEIITSYSGGTPSRSNPKFYNGNIPWIKSGELNQKEIFGTEEFISEEAVINSSAKFVEKDSLLLALYGATAGLPAYSRIKATINQAVLAVKPEKQIAQEYLYFWLLGNRSNIISYYTQGGQPNLSASIVKSLNIILPPLLEQRAIAAVLSTWDNGINKLQQLIDAKQKRKKALMQQLLTGRKRFREFVKEDGFKETKIGLVPQDWQLLYAREIFKNISIKNRPEEELLAVTQELGVIPRSMLEGRVMMPAGSTSGYKLVEKGNFVISLRSFQGGLEYSNFKGIVSPAYTILKEIREIDKEYFRYFFKSVEFISRLSVAVIGIRDGKQISYDDFGAMTFRFPPLKEQTKIASVLQAADKEINTLQQKLDALKQQKKGLMQKLLTGQVRVNLTTEPVN